MKGCVVVSGEGKPVAVDLHCSRKAGSLGCEDHLEGEAVLVYGLTSCTLHVGLVVGPDGV